MTACRLLQQNRNRVSAKFKLKAFNSFSENFCALKFLSTTVAHLSHYREAFGDSTGVRGISHKIWVGSRSETTVA